MRFGICCEKELEMPASSKSPVPTPQMVEGRMMYDRESPTSSAAVIARSTFQ